MLQGLHQIKTKDDIMGMVDDGYDKKELALKIQKGDYSNIKKNCGE